MRQKEDHNQWLQLISVHDTSHAGALGELSAFRERVYHCLTARADAWFELTDAVLCADGPVASLAELSLTPEHRRGHGAGYDAINHGNIQIGRLRTTLAGLSLDPPMRVLAGSRGWGGLARGCAT